jgi:hypothetical protein
MKRTKNMKRRSPSLHYLPKGLLLLLLLPSLLMACSDEQGTTGSEMAALSIGQVTTKTLNTRSTTAVTSGDIGVFMSGSGYTTQSNVKYSYASPWTTTTPIYLLPNSASICAYYPYSTSITDATAVPLTSQIYSSSADLCYAVNTDKTSANTSINFVMSRAYAMITFNIIHEETYTGACVVSNISMDNAGVNATGTLNITTGVLASTTAGTVNITPSSAITVATNSISSIQALLVPVSTAMTGYITFSFTVDGTERVATIAASSLSTLVAGTTYTINASMEKTGLTTTLASISGTGNMSLVAEPANCYMVAPSNAITISVNIKGNGGDVASTGLSITHTAASIGILWQTSTGLITVSSFNATTQQVTVTAGTASGNAVIAAYDTDGTTILWSWHIWVTSYNPNTTNGTVYMYNDRTWMDRNLGATTNTPATVTTMGLLYQWGRKDPFPGSTSVSVDFSEPTLVGKFTSVAKTIVTEESNLANTILNPVTFYLGSDTPEGSLDWYSSTWGNNNAALWGGASMTTPTAKTIFDPCPAGWRVPGSINELSPWYGFTDSNFPWTSYGRVFTSASSTYYPSSGFRTSTVGTLYKVGVYGGYWLASAFNHSALYFAFTTTTVSEYYSIDPAFGFSVRCIQE